MAEDPKNTHEERRRAVSEVPSEVSNEAVPAPPTPRPDVAPDSADTAVAPPVTEQEVARSSFPPWVPLVIAALLPLAFFFFLPPLTKSGLWDPYELNVADLARRIAVNLHGAASLALDGADNSLPHLNDLGRPQLAFTSIALGFKMFGLHEWSGRLPLAVWGLFGVLATYGFVAKLVDRRAALYAAAALTTMPLYFVQARTMLGDVVPMAATAMAFGGLAVAAFDRDSDGPTPLGARVPWLLLGVLGLACGYWSRGALLGVAAPMLGVGLAWAMLAAAGARTRDGVGEVVAAASLGVGLAVLARGLHALGAEHPHDLDPWVGAMIKVPQKYPTFDYVIGQLGPALAPWSAFVPVAAGRLFLPPVGRRGALLGRETAARVALLVGAGVAFTLQAWLAARTDLVAFLSPAILAAICGVALRDFERGAHPSVAVGVAVMVFLGLFHHDFHELPEKAYQAFAVNVSTFPETFKNQALMLWTVVLIGFAGVAFLTWVERDADRRPFDPARYVGILDALRGAFDGGLALAFLALVGGTSLAGLLVLAGTRLHAQWLPVLSLQTREAVLNAWWVLAIVPLGVVFGAYFACDVWLWGFGRSRPLSSVSLTRGFEPFEELLGEVRTRTGEERLVAILVLLPLMVLAVPAAVMVAAVSHGTKPVFALALAIPSGVAAMLVLGVLGDLLRGRRAAGMALGGVAFGAVLCVSYYPALANQLSPKEVFESYRRAHKGDEPLALFGVGGRTAAYYAGGEPTQFHDAPGAFAWLTGTGDDGRDARRYLAVKADELPKLNQLYRERSQPRENLPVLDARSSQILLAASRLEPSEKNQNPLDKILLTQLPKPQRPLGVNMEDKLFVSGYDITDTNGHLVEAVAPGRAYRIRTYYKVLAPLTTEWEAFIHIDGFRRRHNGDHKPMDGKYPFSLWLPDDLLVDDYEFKLEPNFSPGNYVVYFGLFVGDTRLKVKSGPSDGDNRINGGTLRVQ